jgi:CheY-like chemotaxis protein
MRLVGQLAGGIAHDFNNQLASIFGYSDLLAANLPEGPEREAADQIAKAAQRSADLTRQLLVFARKEVARREPFSVNDLAREMAVLLGRSVDRRIRVAVRAEAASYATGDASLIQTALLNLALNARDAMPHGGTLTIAASDVEIGPDFASALGERPAPGPYVRASVTDTGTGIAPEIQRRLFEPFFTTKRDKGTGLGLAGVYGAVKAHGGFVDFRSEPGLGSEFAIYLPAAESRHVGAVPVRQAVATPPARCARILLVDDEESILRLNTLVLTAEGHEVLACPDGFAALVRYRAEGPTIDLVILDMLMPRISGAEVAAAIRLANPNAKILICTGFSDIDEGSIARGPGATAFLRKPFLPRDLVAKVWEMLDQPT